jgi:hypothetical protein
MKKTNWKGNWKNANDRERVAIQLEILAEIIRGGRNGKLTLEWEYSFGPELMYACDLKPICGVREHSINTEFIKRKKKK